MESADGKPCGVTVQIDDHPRDARPYAVNEIADCWNVDRGEIVEVLERGTRKQLLHHLGSHTKEELMPLKAGRVHVDPRRPWPWDG